jgi:o-succinylbenzoate synthase
LYFKRPAGTSRGLLRTKQSYFLRLARQDEADKAAGWGECGPVQGLSVDDRPDLAAQLADVCRLINAGASPERLDLSAWPAISFGLEMARLDLQKGGQRQLFPTSLDKCATEFYLGQASLPIHGLIWMGSREGILRQVEQKVAQGFTCIKMKVGALDVEQEYHLLAEIRQRFPASQIQLRLDANGAYEAEEAFKLLQRLAEFDIHFIEQPIKAKQWPKLAQLCATSPIPIALDEELIGIQHHAQRQALLETIRPQHIVLKPMLLGGFAAAQEWIDLAETLGIGWWINSALESNVGLNALCQWTSFLNTGRIHGLGTGQLYTNNLPSPLRLSGPSLRYEQSAQWDFSPLTRLRAG